MTCEQCLQAGAKALGLTLSPPAVQRMLDYLDELVRWNRVHNLSAVRDPQAMVARHLLDSLSVVPLLPRGQLADVGTGAGLPGIPLAIFEPRRSVTLIESNGKKAIFLRHVKRRLALDNVTVVQARSQAHRPVHPYTGVISRAFASLPGMLAAAGHLCSPDGFLLAMKGRLPDSEIAALPADIRVLATHRLQVPFTRGERHLIVLSSPSGVRL